jgi:NAD(P)-dependent dehydrogenase (short-subunit alcohol dehydrogenase family)
MEKTIFITGASSGLGKATAKLFARKGWHVIATMRKPEAEAELTKIQNIRLLALDVTNKEQIGQVVSDLTKSTNVDVVFNNAGYGLGGSFEGATEEQIKRQIDTNLLGVFRVSNAFLPHFRKKQKGIFITTTSIGGHMALPLFSLYHATKWALEGWSESLWYELKQFNIKVKTVAPGGIKTDFSGRSLVLSEHESYKTITEKVLAAFSDPKRSDSGSTPEQIAEVVYKAATDNNFRLRYIAGKDAKLFYRIRKLLGYKFFMRQIEKTFFKK